MLDWIFHLVNFPYWQLGALVLNTVYDQEGYHSSGRTCNFCLQIQNLLVCFWQREKNAVAIQLQEKRAFLLQKKACLLSAEKEAPNSSSPRKTISLSREVCLFTINQSRQQEQSERSPSPNQKLVSLQIENLFGCSRSVKTQERFSAFIFHGRTLSPLTCISAKESGCRKGVCLWPERGIQQNCGLHTHTLCINSKNSLLSKGAVCLRSYE